ncbi:ASCH domain-containing protein [Mycetocola reblochoni]|uniref:Uncharacterized protein n=3 Tax=Mycetocola reblochoni TaxID=331618 RepID=A0A1R4JP38_9MICO|nr:ASCH domain-containing protein [Mycetocola reblochoni]SJN34021.1 hypothetical protein FM119_08715 [Mycetocola reblochoni REB411]
MRVLTVRQPWASAIIHGGKDVENRVRNIAGTYRGPVAIHAAAGKAAEITDEQEARLLAADADELGGIAAWLDGEPIRGGVILGVVDLVDVHSVNDCGGCSEWGEPEHHHLVLRDARPVVPVPYRGALGLRWLDADTYSALHAQGVTR